MPTHPFLSPEWIAEARKIHDEYADRAAEPAEAVRMNVTIHSAPFTDDQVLGHIDTTDGSVVPDHGHLDNPDVAVKLPYDLARQLLIDPQPDKVMASFMSGVIEVEGDVTLMMSLEDVDASPEQQALAEEVVARLNAITE